ncbi:MAG: hypothetical protein D8M59_10055 [Planctomycetes bacterium]|nr:hypothetical protein [Planctomycetota bacterium]NOG53398.1 hypothetical protein [Planctomycetota bacterium]
MVSNERPNRFEKEDDATQNDEAVELSSSDAPLFCLRCGKHLTPGSGDFYLVRIEGIADPWPPSISAEDLADVEHLASEMQRLIEQSANLSEQELMDQVYRAETIFLCTPCFRTWIERPAAE